MRQYHVRDIMSQPAIVIEWDVSILDAAEMMEANGVRRLPVVNEDGQVIGIVSLGDVREATSVYNTASPYAPDHDEILLAVDEIMATPVKTVSADDTILSVIKRFLEYKIGGLPVVDDQLHPLGMITETDIFRLLVHTWEEIEVQEA